MKQFLLSDESRNSYGFKVSTKGINLKNFENNPVMYYNHDRDRGVIGKWTGLRVKKNKLFGTPLFDENDTLGADIARKVNDGFIRAVSIGLDNARFEDINGELVVVSCDMIECSICDIPSNKNALMLYVDDKPVTGKDEIVKLYKNQTDMKTDFKPITQALALSNNVSVAEIVTAIEMLKNNNSPEQIIEEAVKMNFIAQYEKTELLQLASASPVAFQKYLEKRKEKAVHEREEEGLTLLNLAIRDGRINANATGTIKDFWMKSFASDFEGTKLAVAELPKRVSLSQMVSSSSSDEGRSGWTLQDYRKNAPLELKNNPALYHRLVEQEKDNI